MQDTTVLQQALKTSISKKATLELHLEEEIPTIEVDSTQVGQKVGFEVKTAEDGQEGLEIFGQHRDEISAVLLDLTMPRLNGQETFSEMRRIHSDVKVVLMSGFNSRDVAKRIPTEHLADYLKKPFQVIELAQKITDVLK